jgi:hypothetical protein
MEGARNIHKKTLKSVLFVVLLDALVFPVSPWTLRAHGQVVHHVRLSGGAVLGGEHFYLWGKTCVLYNRSL